ncbi:MAG: PD40 domain-containing protein [Steroidobacteraceae bacterium]|nr:PD40 domain-containing protein [Steroidobacteraceae bacterium]
MSFAWFLPGPWTPPFNLGPAVNTNGTEQRATLSNDGKRLYFGRVLEGGTSDIYVSERKR